MEINVQSKASRNQLNLPHGTETKPEMVKKRLTGSLACIYMLRAIERSAPSTDRAALPMDR